MILWPVAALVCGVVFSVAGLVQPSRGIFGTMSDISGKRSFFKYASHEAALAMLKSKTVRYSSPLLFNDPFDMQAGLNFDFDVDLLNEKLVARMEQLSRGPEEPLVDKDDPWGQMILLMREKISTHGFGRALIHTLANSYRP